MHHSTFLFIIIVTYFYPLVTAKLLRLYKEHAVRPALELLALLAQCISHTMLQLRWEIFLKVPFPRRQQRSHRKIRTHDYCRHERLSNPQDHSTD